MSTAHRPTWNAARGAATTKESSGSWQFSARDLASHTELKVRKEGQDTAEELAKRDLKAELEARERAAQEKRRRGDEEGLARLARNVVEVKPSVAGAAAAAPLLPPSVTGGAGPAEDEEDQVVVGEHGEAKRLRLVDEATARLDADDNASEAGSEGGRASGSDGAAPASGSDEDEDEDEDDETAELLRQLEQIKKERAEQAAKETEEKKQSEQKVREEAFLRGNPLLNQSGPADFTVKRRWDDDVVFRNTTRGASERAEKRFINDTLRSDFHRKFMAKFIR